MFDTPELRAALKTAVDEAVEAATTGLASKNKQLLTELKEARKGREIDPAEIEKLEAKIDTLDTELKAAQKAAKDSAKMVETATKTLETEKRFTQKLLIDNGLVSELTKHGITNAVHLKAAQAMLRNGVEIVADGDNRTAKVGDKTLTDFVKEWAAGDEGKHFVSAPGNSGGGAQGGKGGNGTAKTMSRADYDSKVASGDQTVNSFFADGGKLTD